MTLGDWLSSSSTKLSAAGISSAQLDCLILAEDLLNKDRTHLLARPEIIVSATQLKKLNNQIARRIEHEPLSYIRGKSYFYGRVYLVSPRTLEPRPETETMIELLLSLKLSSGSIIDVGTGSGCIAITAKLELPNMQVLALDISPQCLKASRANAEALGAEITIIKSDLLLSLPSTIYHLPSTILANLPYVPDGWNINQAATHEPRLAIFGGPDGLDYYRQLFKQVRELGTLPKYILTECMPPQHANLALIAKKHGYKLAKTQNFVQVYSS